MKHQNEINSNLDNILGNDSVLTVLLEFEGFLSNLDMYAFKHWQHGEVVDGPHLSRYWVTVTLMYPYKMLPDPLGAERLLAYDCKVSYKKIKYTRPVKIVTQADLEVDDKGKRVPKMISSPAWLVTIKVPRRFIDEVTYSSFESDVGYDEDAVNDAYQQGMDTESLLKGNDQHAQVPPTTSGI